MSEFKLIFLGTCAHDFSPKLSDKCRSKFDRNARRGSSVLVNGRYLIDCGPHCCNSLDIIGKKYSDITDILVTHFHSDHFDVECLRKIAESRATPVRVWVRSDAELPNVKNVQYIRMYDGSKYRMDGDITVTGLKANHDQSVFPQWFLLERNGKKMLYALDGAWFLTDTYNYLKNAHLNLFVMDATVGNKVGDYRMAEHNSIPMIRMMLPSLREVNIIDDKTVLVLSHIAPSLHRPHVEISRLAKHFKARVAYDGMKIEI